MPRADAKTAWRTYRSPGTVIGRFVARRTARGAAFWALAFGALVASKAAGFASAYPTAAERTKIAATFGHNVGLSALLGLPHKISTVAGFTTWNTLGVMVLIGSIWAFLLATKNFRGEEDNGRWEILIAGPTTAKRAALNVLAGLGASLLVFYAVVAVTFVLVGRIHTVGYSPAAGLFFALAAIAGAAMFMVVGAAASQVMPTRAMAARLSALIFGVCFLVRVMADTTSAHWLLNITPLGWVERLQPLFDPKPVWLLPIAVFIGTIAGLAVYLANRRDLGDSTIADHDSAKPKIKLLKTPLTAAFRLTRTTNLSWLMAMSVMSLFYGLLTKSAAQAFSTSLSAEHALSKIAHAAQAAGATIFLSIAFLLIVTVLMAYTASAVGALREDEAQGYLDNLLVRPVSRWQWLSGRLSLIGLVLVAACLLTGTVMWFGESSQHSGVSYHTLLSAGFNMLGPAILALGIAVFSFGVVPRLTTVIAYGVIAWSFLIEMVSSGINLNHWIQDTSVLHHIALAPATDPNWHTDLKLALIGLVLISLGAVIFNRRDLQAE